MRVSIFLGSKLQVASSFRQCVRVLMDAIKQCCGDRVKIAYGGGITGCMQEVYEGAQRNHLQLLSVNCTKWACPEDQKCADVVYFDTILDRQNHLMRVGDAYIVCPGGVGTIFEFMQSITCNDVNEEKEKKPIYVLNYNNYFMHLIDFLEWGRKCGMITKTNEQLKLKFFDNGLDLAREIARNLE